MIFQLTFWQSFAAAFATVCCGVVLCHFSGIYSWSRPKGDCNAGERSRPAETLYQEGDGQRVGGGCIMSGRNCLGYSHNGSVGYCGAIFYLHVGASAIGGTTHCNGAGNPASAVQIFGEWPRCGLGIGLALECRRNIPRTGNRIGRARALSLRRKPFLAFGDAEQLCPAWLPGSASGEGGTPVEPESGRCRLKM